MITAVDNQRMEAILKLYNDLFPGAYLLHHLESIDDRVKSDDIDYKINSCPSPTTACSEKAPQPEWYSPHLPSRNGSNTQLPILKLLTFAPVFTTLPTPSCPRIAG